MGIRKKANSFGKDLRSVMMDHGKLNPDVMGYVLAAELIAFYTHDDPVQGLNDMMNTVLVAAGDQGFKMTFGPPPTVH